MVGTLRPTPRGTPRATGATDGRKASAGLTPQMAIVETDRTPTVFFYRWLLTTSEAAARAAGGAGFVPGDDTEVIFNKGGVLGADAGFVFHDETLFLLGPPGTGVAAPVFNSTAIGTERAFQQKDGSFYVTGAGDGYFQNLIVTNTFNSEATGTTAAVQQYQGTFVIFGNGNAQFQALALGGPLKFPDGTIQTTAFVTGTAGTVTSVFGRSGAVVAVTGDYTVAQVTGAVPNSRTITAGAGLSGGGDLTANRSLAVTPATAAALGGVKIGANITVQADGTISVAGGGTPPPASALVLGSDAAAAFIAAPLASGKLWIGSAGNLPVAQAITGDITITAAGVVSVKGVSAATAPGATTQVIFNDAGLLGARAGFTFTPATNAVAVAGAITAGGGVSATNFVAISDAAGTNRALRFQTSGANRWTLRVEATAETGGNAGSDFTIYRNDDSGAAVSALAINRASGLVAIAGLNVTGSVGIGTAAPYCTLTVAGASLPASSANSGLARFSISAGTGAQTDDNLLFGVQAGTYAWIQAVRPGTAVLSLLLNPQGGNVGIGIVTPGAPLDVQSGLTDTQMLIGGGSDATAFEIGRVSASGFLRFNGRQSGFAGYIFSNVDHANMLQIAPTGAVTIAANLNAGSYSVGGTAGFTGPVAGRSALNGIIV